MILADGLVTGLLFGEVHEGASPHGQQLDAVDLSDPAEEHPPSPQAARLGCRR